jgi:NAD(P)-dependent dehydrogenase (short-subunit alcohol dehydrogenase family)
MRLFDLTGRVAIVTGSSKGLGRAAALALAEAGGNVVIVSRHLTEAEDAADEAGRFGPACLAIEADVTREEDVDRLVSRSVAHFGRLDVLVNNAGVNWRKPVLDFTAKDWRDMLETNLIACHLCAKAACVHMVRQRRGNIVNISSMLASIVIPERAVYAASKAGLVQLTKYLAVELAEYGVRANAVCPGPFETDLVRRLMQSEGSYNYFLQRIPLKRIGQPAEIGGTVVYLASDASSFVTGTTIYIDGGWSAL